MVDVRGQPGELLEGKPHEQFLWGGAGNGLFEVPRQSFTRQDWHRVLKSGCQIEHLQYQTATRLERVVTIHLVIAWRIMLMTLLGRQSPDWPAQILFSNVEIKVLPSDTTSRICGGVRCGGAVRRTQWHGSG